MNPLIKKQIKISEKIKHYHDKKNGDYFSLTEVIRDRKIFSIGAISTLVANIVFFCIILIFFTDNATSEIQEAELKIFINQFSIATIMLSVLGSCIFRYISDSEYSKHILLNIFIICMLGFLLCSGFLILFTIALFAIAFFAENEYKEFKKSPYKYARKNKHKKNISGKEIGVLENEYNLNLSKMSNDNDILKEVYTMKRGGFHQKKLYAELNNHLSNQHTDFLGQQIKKNNEKNTHVIINN